MYTLTSEKEDRQNRIPAKGLNPNTTFLYSSHVILRGFSDISSVQGQGYWIKLPYEDFFTQIETLACITKISVNLHLCIY